MLEFEFSSHGAGMIHAYRWEPEGQPRGVVQIIHGIAEYVPRYAGFAAFLNARLRKKKCNNCCWKYNYSRKLYCWPRTS